MTTSGVVSDADDTARRKVMGAFGVTEDDMSVMDRIEDANGYTAAKKEADSERATFVGALTVRLTLSMQEFNRGMQRATWQLRRLSGVMWRAGLRADGDPLCRPDGRPRRTGHRHRGTDAWARRGGRRGLA